MSREDQRYAIRCGMSREDQRYAIRLRSRARREMSEAHIRLAEITDREHAIAWYNGCLDAIALLADNPSRNPAAYESRYFRGIVHSFTYRLTTQWCQLPRFLHDCGLGGRCARCCDPAPPPCFPQADDAGGGAGN